MSTAPARIFGLDVLRASAVLLVLIGHISSHQHPPAWFRWFWNGQGTLGVELFYVLSGFLIGHILIRSARSGRLHGISAVLDFWERRWARTLPLYFFFLLIYLRFDYLGVGDLSKMYPFIFFMQNFAWPQMPFFQHSWSLAVEEWFYFLFPLIFLWFAQDERAYRRPMLGTCAFFIVGPLLIRVIIARTVGDWSAFDARIRGVVLCRLDSIFVGVLLALIKIEWPTLYAKARCFSLPAALTTVGIMFYLAAGTPGLVQSYIGKVLFFPLLSVCLALVIPGLERVGSLGWKPLDAFVSYTSRVSYSLYLGHICMITLVESLMLRMGIRTASSLLTMAIYGTFFVAIYGLAALTYSFVELPYIMLRDARLGHSDERSGEVAVAMAVSTSRNN